LGEKETLEESGKIGGYIVERKPMGENGLLLKTICVNLALRTGGHLESASSRKELKIRRRAKDGKKKAGRKQKRNRNYNNREGKGASFLREEVGPLAP